VACTVFVPHSSSNHVGDGFKSTVGMIWKTTTIVIGIITAKVIEHQEGIEPSLVSLCQNPCEFDTIAVSSGLACHLLFNATTLKGYFAGGHGL
jgi:hypothetical protein